MSSNDKFRSQSAEDSSFRSPIFDRKSTLEFCNLCVDEIPYNPAQSSISTMAMA